KIIGARYYTRGFEEDAGPLESQNETFFRSARDSNGHGTHVASTVAGSVVNNGNSINRLKMDKFHPVIFAEDAAAAGVSTFLASLCQNGTLDHKLIEGKIVVCSGLFSSDKAIVVRDGGGVGMIFSMKAVAGINDVSVHYVIPTTVLDIKEIQALQNYVSLSKNPTARISPTTTILNSTRAPKMAFFSSVGPNTITPDIIKV
ncbi:hypothetical protein MKX03_022793, partial [Papaver bracteatum]